MGKYNIAWLVCGFLFVAVLGTQTFAQVTGNYPNGKMVLKNGTIVEGKNLVLTTTTATLTVGGAPQTFNLSEVNQIMAKGNNAQKGCLIGAGGCAALGLLVYVVSDDEAFREQDYESKSDATGPYFLGLALWSGCLGGIGYLIGKGSDDWNIVYVAQSGGAGLDEYLKLGATTDILSPALVLGRYLTEEATGQVVLTK